eukprot:872259_1
MSINLTTISNYILSAFKWLKGVIKPYFTWRSTTLLCLGGIGGIILSFNYTKNITYLTALQLTGKIFQQSAMCKYNHIKYNIPSEWKKIIPTAPVRPSKELIHLISNLKTTFHIDPNWTPQQHFDYLQKLF